MGFDHIATDLRQDDPHDQNQEEYDGPQHGALEIEHEDHRNEEGEEGDDLDHPPSLEGSLCEG